MKKGQYVLVGLLLVLVLAFTACTPKAVAPTPAVAVPVPQGQTRQAWEVEWEKLMANAKKEGKVTVYATSIAPNVRTFLAKTAMDRFRINADFLEGRGAEVATKLLAERRAGLYLSDVYIGGSTTVMTQLKPAEVLASLDDVVLLPEVLDPKVWWGGKLLFIDDAHTLLAFAVYPSPSVAINPNVVKREEADSYRKFLEPRWKGKISINDPTVAGTGGKWFAVNGVGVDGKPILGLDFMRELTKQNPVIVRDQRLQMEWLTQGKYPIAIAPVSAMIADFMEAGAPVQLLTPKEGSYLTSGVGNVGLIARPAHPSAARVFINWLLSKEGQTLFSQANLIQSGRLDVPTKHLPADKMRDPTATYVFSEVEKFILRESEHQKLAREIFGPLLR